MSVMGNVKDTLPALLSVSWIDLARAWASGAILFKLRDSTSQKVHLAPRTV